MNTGTRAPPGQRTAGHPSRRYHGGFTLVEVLITAVVTMIALTGLATLQVLTLRAANSSLQRSQATALAYEIIDRMRLNRGASGLTDTALGGGYDDRTFCNETARRANDTQPCGISAPPSNTDTGSIAIDLRAWWTSINNSGLPRWYAAIRRAGQTFTVSVQWDDGRTEDDGDRSVTLRASCLGSEMPTAMQEICIMTQL
ncbi:type IV pilus modification protein PilV [Candidatus Thiodictyon syntrophicum]|jgi:type IV pilus assembly protein PilV|uniref:Type IV pilus modification protein PilV n=1 Tax=Candidatus Thiodictyon syntrophicum TaxID=1166950 RepID=A0A2K8UA02_9GAMM|nr:type IV pilus modification protein PilV [Candidatus Thiodictyon syntrophicum]AUB81881.1 type IV pilus modification protein PilV [Candidatus Thiodictyon syntrophicum]